MKLALFIQRSLIVLLLGCGSIVKGDINSGLIFYAPLDGDLTDASGHATSGVNNGAFFVPDRLGYSDGALLFDGVNDVAEFLIPSLPAYAHPRTLSLWLRSDFVGQRAWNEHFAGYGRYPTREAFGFALGSDPFAGHNGRLVGYLGYDDTYTPFFATAGEWMFVVHTYDGTTSSVYVNGSLKGHQTLITETVGETPFSLGARYAPESGQTYYDFFKGAIDDVRIWERSLSPVEVFQLFTVPEPTLLTMLGAGISICFCSRFRNPSRQLKKES